jgi:hypothetical protein
MKTGDYGLELLHTACNNFAPDGKVQRGFSKVRRQMEEANEPSEKIAGIFASLLADGLRWGNWPNAR